ncbi:MAG: TRIC cation channel family protein [bacterium]|nr:TRIC cation channel family protein [bacterium]
MKVWFILEMIGTIAFAISGAGVAIEKKMDIFGVAILGTTTAVGGGIIRDILLGVIPPVAFREPVYAIVAITVSLIVFIPKIRKILDKRNSLPIIIMDSVGLAVFTVIGVRAGMECGNIFLSVFVGVLTGVGGGVLRDLFAGNKPHIFIKHFYACASLIGALAAALLWGFGENISMIVGASLTVLLRLLAAKFRWSLPKA